MVHTKASTSLVGLHLLVDAHLLPLDDILLAVLVREVGNRLVCEAAALEKGPAVEWLAERLRLYATCNGNDMSRDGLKGRASY